MATGRRSAQPTAWLTQVAKNRALDRLRRTTLIDGKHRELAIDVAELERETPDMEAALDEDIDDDMLRLIFTACHPVLLPEQRAALASCRNRVSKMEFRFDEARRILP